MSKTWEAVKDPDEIRDFGVDWAPDLAGKTIVASAWTVQSGTVSVAAHNHTTTTTTVRLTAGVLNETCALVNRVTLSSGEEFEQTCKLRIKAR